ncbi:WD40 repeat-like protein [Boletus reticuloceps]|uniref:WD40 repeat-like protein n=1 Tax=Boletus reticuloceps TaxID=495285 RepID=A0A8I2YQ64_9AGAM|nr:WD40 repeat-like protein [Boletus reticuloceps]
MGPYQCDALSARRLSTTASSLNRVSSPPLDSHFQVRRYSTSPPMLPPPQPSPGRKLCVRHQRIADQGTNLKLQQALDALPEEERQVVNSIWSNFSSSSHPRRELVLQGILTMCCFSQLSLLTEQLGHLIRIDPLTVLPREVSLKILAYLDATSLCRAAQVSKHWRSLADDDILWHEICQQHIGQKCLKCGWGLPILGRRRQARPGSASPFMPPSPPPSKRELETPKSYCDRPLKRQRSDGLPDPHSQPMPSPSSPASASTSPIPSSYSQSIDLLTPPATTHPDTMTRPWKDVYSERLTIERNWRRGRCLVRTLRGHTDGVLCLQFSETLQHPSFPVLITGSYDRTVRVWNLEAGLEVHCLRGHTRAVRALQFDEAKLITGSMDHTIRVWNWRKGECIRTLEGHTDGVVCLNFNANILASGSADSTVKIWNSCTGEAFTLRGHHDWVNAVRLWDAHENTNSSPDCTLNIETGKMLFSASDDGTIRLWDLAQRTCVRQFTGHVGQVQSLRTLDVDVESDEDDNLLPSDGAENSSSDVVQFCRGSTPADVCTVVTHDTKKSNETMDDKWSANRTASNSTSSVTGKPAKKPVLISGSLDNTIKVWDVETGKATRTLFGHIEGVWAVACDKLRLVSGSHDRTIKVWNREEGRCTTTLFGHRGAVTCIGLGEDKIVSGSDDCDVRIWSFSDHE